jgi:hypothetical protein
MTVCLPVRSLLFSVVISMTAVGCELIVFGFIAHDDDRRVRHATALAFEAHRSLLTIVMKSFDQVERRMAAIDKQTNKIKSVHDGWRRQAETIPRRWEANEDLLNFLVVPSSLQLTYALLEGEDSMAYSPFYHQAAADVDGPTAPKNEAPSYDSLEQVLVHLTR